MGIFVGTDCLGIMFAISILSRSRPEGLKKTAGQKGDLRGYLVREMWLNLARAHPIQCLPDNFQSTTAGKTPHPCAIQPTHH